MTEEFHLFWRGPFSQWFKRDFTIDEVKYNCPEQFMMASKARLFKDNIALKKIMQATNPYDQKAYGRNVEFFDVGKWEAVAKDYVFDANYAKFTQHEDLKQIILSTGEKTLVEASPYDKIWGIGLSEDDARALDRTTWLGRNWLGEVLTNVRNKIRSEQ